MLWTFDLQQTPGDYNVSAALLLTVTFFIVFEKVVITLLSEVFGLILKIHCIKLVWKKGEEGKILIVVFVTRRMLVHGCSMNRHNNDVIRWPSNIAVDRS